MLSASSDGTVRVWDTRGLLREDPLDHAATRPRTAAALFSATGAEGDTDDDVQAGDIMSVKFSVSGMECVSCSRDGTFLVRTYDGGWLDGEVKRGHSGAVYDCDFSPDGRLLVTVGEDCSMRFWEDSGSRAVANYSGHKADVCDKALQHTLPGVRSVAFGPDGSQVVSSGTDGFVFLWDVETGSVLSRMSGHFKPVWCVDFSCAGNVCVSGAGDNQVRLWDIRTGKPVRRMLGHGGDVLNCRFSPDGSSVLSSCSDSEIILWNAGGSIDYLFQKHRAGVHGITFTSTGRHILSAGDDRRCLVYDSSSFGVVAEWRCASAATCVAASSVGSGYIACGDSTGRTSILRAHSGVAGSWRIF